MTETKTETEVSYAVLCAHEAREPGTAARMGVTDEAKAIEQRDKRNGQGGRPDCKPWRAVKVTTTTTIEEIG